MEVRKLSSVSFDEIITCFLLAFENYYVQMPTDKAYYQTRWQMAKVDYDLSYGMFDEDTLVGFIIHAIDKRNGHLTAFNTGTGVLPAYRGRRIVKAIYEYALSDLKLNGITKCGLEVITLNETAIRSYKSIGFEICKNYKCYLGNIQTACTDTFELQEVNHSEIVFDQLPNQNMYSWDNQPETILGGNYKFYQVAKNNEPESYFIINPETGYVAQFDLLKDDETAWNRLFTGMKSISEKVKIINVDERHEQKLHHINLAGIQNTVDQYEMELILN